MMAGTILLVFLILSLASFLIYALIKGKNLPRKKFILSLSLILIAIISVFFYTGFKKVYSDISRIIHNASPKSPIEIYTILFDKPIDSCITIVNLKDQVIPKVDCCIWMEVKLCPAELNRICNSKKYVKSVHARSDYSIFLEPFSDRPKWWMPQKLSDSLTKLTIKFSQDKQQSIFFGADSSHVYICDQAL